MTTGSVHDAKVMDNRIREDDRAVYGDQGYANDEKKRQAEAVGVLRAVKAKVAACIAGALGAMHTIDGGEHVPWLNCITIGGDTVAVAPPRHAGHLVMRIEKLDASDSVH